MTAWLYICGFFLCIQVHYEDVNHMKLTIKRDPTEIIWDLLWPLVVPAGLFLAIHEKITIWRKSKWPTPPTP